MQLLGTLVAGLATLLLVSGTTLRREWTIEEEVKEWQRRGLPQVVRFGHIGNETVEAHLLAMPETYALGAKLGWGGDKASKIKYYLYTRDNQNVGTRVTRNVNELKEGGFDGNRPTKIIVHGFGNNIDSDIFKDIIPNFLKAGDFNVIGVDWGKLCPKPLYITARNNVKVVGQDIAKTVDFLVEKFGVKMEDVHVIGHSLGAHVAGTTGKSVTSGHIGRVTGLDPAMPLFLSAHSDRLAQGDGKLVDVIHTCAGFVGLEQPLGDVDFYPNGGQDPQPGCILDLIGICSHRRAYELFAESILEKNAFQAVWCDSEDEARSSKCSPPNGKPSARMGYNLQYASPGVYFLETASSEPFDKLEHSSRMHSS